MAIKWRDLYSVNNEVIDRQHKRLFEIGNMLLDIVSSRDELDHYDEILRIIGELKEYTIYHFDYEEGLMGKAGYAGLAAHKAEHAAFVSEVERKLREDLDANQKESVLQLVMVVTDWITSHILKTDMQYKTLLGDAVRV